MMNTEEARRRLERRITHQRTQLKHLEDNLRGAWQLIGYRHKELEVEKTHVKELQVSLEIALKALQDIKTICNPRIPYDQRGGVGMYDSDGHAVRLAYSYAEEALAQIVH